MVKIETRVLGIINSIETKECNYDLDTKIDYVRSRKDVFSYIVYERNKYLSYYTVNNLFYSKHIHIYYKKVGK